MIRMRSASALLLFAAFAMFAGCGGGGSGGGSGGTAAGSTASTGSGATSTGGGSTQAVAAVTTVRLPAAPAGGLHAGDVAVVFRIVDGAAAPATVEVAFSKDNGATWATATPAASSAGLSGLATAAAPGAEHTFTWATARDLPTSASALVRVSLAGNAAAGATAGPIIVDNQPLSTAVQVSRKPYLQLTQQTSTIIAWRTDQDTDSVIEFGETPALGQRAGDPSARAKAHDALLTGLRPGTRYHYRVSSGGAPVTARGTFNTAPAPTSADFSFMAFGDSGTLSAEQMQVARLMTGQQADFAIHTGDVIYPVGGLLNGVREYDDRFFKPYEGFLDRMPMFPVIGNHDLIALVGQPFKESFFLPDNNNPIARELYFSFEWGDARFIALETTALFLVPLGEHMRWLNDQITNNPRKWLFVYMHVPLYSSGNHGDNRILQQVLGPLLENGKVDLVITGHDHHYERSKPIKQFNRDPAYPGLVHIVTGGGGAGTYGVNPTSRTDVSVRANHYMRFQVQGDQCHGEAIDLQGQVIDRFTIQNQ